MSKSNEVKGTSRKRKSAKRSHLPRYLRPNRDQTLADFLALPLQHVVTYLTYPAVLALNSSCSGAFNLSVALGGEYNLACSASSRAWLGLGEQWAWMMEKRRLEHTWLCSVSATWPDDAAAVRAEALEAIFDNSTKFLEYYRDFSRPEEDQLLECCLVDREDAVIQEFLHEQGPNYVGRTPRSRSVRTGIAQYRWGHHAWTLYLRILDASGVDDEALMHAQEYIKDNPEIAAAICTILAVRFDGTIGDETGLRQLVPLALNDSDCEPNDLVAAWPVPEGLIRSERGSGRKHLGGWNVEAVEAFARLEAKATTLLFCHPPLGFPHPLIADDCAFSLLELVASTVRLQDLDKLRLVAKAFCRDLDNPRMARLDPLLKAIACMAVVSAQDSENADGNVARRPLLSRTHNDYAIRSRVRNNGSTSSSSTSSSSSSSTSSSSSIHITSGLSSGMSHVSGLSGHELDLVAAIQVVRDNEQALKVLKPSKTKDIRTSTKKGTPQSRGKKSPLPFLSPPARAAATEPPPPLKRFWRLW
jgi:hypothetical protein